MPVSPGKRSAAWRYATEGPYLQCACLLTVAAGKANVAVAEIEGDDVIVAVKTGVAVKVFVAVRVAKGEGVSVHATAVAAVEVAVRVACSSADGPQADIIKIKRKVNQ